MLLTNIKANMPHFSDASYLAVTTHPAYHYPVLQSQTADCEQLLLFVLTDDHPHPRQQLRDEIFCSQTHICSQSCIGKHSLFRYEFTPLQPDALQCASSALLVTEFQY